MIGGSLLAPCLTPYGIRHFWTSHNRMRRPVLSVLEGAPIALVAGACIVPHVYRNPGPRLRRQHRPRHCATCQLCACGAVGPARSHPAPPAMARPETP